MVTGKYQKQWQFGQMKAITVAAVKKVWQTNESFSGVLQLVTIF